MADAATPEDLDSAPRGGLLARRKGLILVALGLSVVALAAGGWFGLTGGAKHGAAASSAAHGAAADPGGHGAAAAQGGAEATGMLDFGDMVVNVTGSSATGEPTSRFLKIRFDMVYADGEKNEKLMDQKKPFVRDAILSYLRQLHEADLRGSDGLFLLKAELLKRARAVVGSDVPREFLIVDLVMQ